MREKFFRGEAVFGAHVFTTDPEVTESLGLHGYEFIWIDGEHAPFDKAELLGHILASSAAGVASIVRVAWNDPVLVKPVLEMGPDGILLPMVSTKEQAERAVAACRYPPHGVRGFGPRRANQYGALPNPDYLEQVDDSFLRIVQIEHVDAVNNLEGIASVEGIDMLMVGPNDLSASIGCLGRTRDPKARALMDEIAHKAKKAGKPFGVSLGPGDRESVREWVERGAVMIGCGDDLSFLNMGARDTLKFLHSLVGRA